MPLHYLLNLLFTESKNNVSQSWARSFDGKESKKEKKHETYPFDTCRRSFSSALPYHVYCLIVFCLSWILLKWSYLMESYRQGRACLSVIIVHITFDMMFCLLSATAFFILASLCLFVSYVMVAFVSVCCCTQKHEIKRHMFHCRSVRTNIVHYLQQVIEKNEQLVVSHWNRHTQRERRRKMTNQQAFLGTRVRRKRERVQRRGCQAIDMLLLRHGTAKNSRGILMIKCSAFRSTVSVPESQSSTGNRETCFSFWHMTNNMLMYSSNAALVVGSSEELVSHWEFPTEILSSMDYKTYQVSIISLGKQCAHR